MFLIIQKITKKILNGYIFVLLIFFVGRISFATPEDPRLTDLAGYIGKFMNVFILAVGFVFAIMVAYGTIKLSGATGDPKGLQGASKTFLYAFIGLIVIAFYFAFYLIIKNTLGIEGFATPGDITGALGDLLEDLRKEVVPPD